MSFWSSYLLVQSAPPPVVTGRQIAAFVRELAATGLIVPGGLPVSCKVKYGPRIDADYETTDLVEWDESGIIGTTKEYPWDRDAKFATLPELADSVTNDQRTVYRAYLSLGTADPDIEAALTRQPSSENVEGLYPSDVSFHIGPQIVQGLASDEPAAVGWMALTFSGPGYFFPWSFKQARQRAQSSDGLKRLTEICRAAWPVAPSRVTKEMIDSRRALGELWLYDDLSIPRDWLWFVSETG
jgi:hypothetical protein